jgi:hypothetical protein
MTLVNELTVEELMKLLKHEVQDVVRTAVREAMMEAKTDLQDQMAILDIPSLDLNVEPIAFSLSRKDMYGDDGR